MFKGPIWDLRTREGQEHPALSQFVPDHSFRIGAGASAHTQTRYSALSVWVEHSAILPANA